MPDQPKKKARPYDPNNPANLPKRQPGEARLVRGKDSNRSDV